MLYKINPNDIGSNDRVEQKSPKDLNLKEEHIEAFLGPRLSEIVSEDQLMQIGRERRGQEEADLLALSKEGILYIFELKRWESKPENILQVMRYGQIFGRYSYGELEFLAQKQKQLDGSLKEKHRVYFQLNTELPESKFNHDQVFVLFTNGLDEDTISAVNFWTQKGIKIECVPYRTYEINGEPYIQWDTYNPRDEIPFEANTCFFIVNTNRSYMPDVWKDMINNGKASAYYSNKNAICRVSRGSVVYLYHTGVGIIAKGHATSNYEEAGEEFYVPLRFDWALRDQSEWDEKAPKAWEINRKIDSSYRFRQTVFSISENMAKAIDDIYCQE
ncbi:MAG: hypothetical protein OXI58_13215 [Gemmatimonadota bacterium]|nr:hypothetical protein [Gemmatimonadota bacterium]